MNAQLHDRKNLQLILSLALMAVIVTVALVAGMRSAHAQQVEAGPRVLAVKLHADWCSSCRAIEPRFQALREKFGREPVLFATLDLTRDASQVQAYYLAAALGLEEVWHAYASEVGYVLLIDADSKRVLARLTRKQDLATMSAQLTQALRAVPPT